MCFLSFFSNLWVYVCVLYVLGMCVEEDCKDFTPAWLKCIYVLAAVQYTKKKRKEGEFLRQAGHFPWPLTKIHKGWIFSCTQLNGLWLSAQWDVSEMLSNQQQCNNNNNNSSDFSGNAYYYIYSNTYQACNLSEHACLIYSDLYDNGKYIVKDVLLLAVTSNTVATGDPAWRTSPAECQKLEHQQVAL